MTEMIYVVTEMGYVVTEMVYVVTEMGHVVTHTHTHTCIYTRVRKNTLVRSRMVEY